MLTRKIEINVFDDSIKSGDAFSMKEGNYASTNIIVVDVDNDRRTLDYMSICRSLHGPTHDIKEHTLSATDISSGKVKLIRLIPEEE